MSRSPQLRHTLAAQSLGDPVLNTLILTLSKKNTDFKTMYPIVTSCLD